MKRPVKSIDPNRLAGAIIFPIDAPDVGPELQAVRAAQPRHLILDLMDPVQELRILDVDLREPVRAVPGLTFRIPPISGRPGEPAQPRESTTSRPRIGPEIGLLL